MTSIISAGNQGSTHTELSLIDIIEGTDTFANHEDVLDARTFGGEVLAVPEDFDPEDHIKAMRDDEDADLLAAGAKSCEWCGRAITLRTGCNSCVVPSIQHLYDGWGMIRHLPDVSDDIYVKQFKRFGYDDHGMVAYFNKYILAMMSYYKEFTTQDFAVAHFLFNECKKSGRVKVSYLAIKSATGVDRNTLRGRKGAKSEPIMTRLKRLGIVEEFETESSKGKISLYLRLTWNPRDNIGISPSQRDEAFQLAMMDSAHKSNRSKSKRNTANKAKVRNQTER